MKIAMIGGGSHFTDAILNSMFPDPLYDGCELVPYDVDEGKLAHSMKRAEKLVAGRSSKIRVTSSMQLEEALQGSRYVIVSCEKLRVPYWHKDLVIPARHGVLQFTGENGGPGGQAHAMRNVTLFSGLFTKVMEICPDAWHWIHGFGIFIRPAASRTISSRPTGRSCHNSGSSLSSQRTIAPTKNTMKNTLIPRVRKIVTAAATSILVCAAQAAAQPLLTMETVPVGAPGNLPDQANGRGSVDYEYHIGKHEVTNAQFVLFLNAVDPDGKNLKGLYHPGMTTSGLGGILFEEGADHGAKYSVKLNFEKKPVNFVSFYAAARFANWLHNGATAGADTESGAYTFHDIYSPPMADLVSRSPDAAYWIPSQDEWYKAAYYLGADAGGYSTHATQSGTVPDPVSASETGEGSAGGEGNSANFNLVAEWNGVAGNVTTVGSNGGPSHFGTFDQNGNLWEWTSTLHPETPGEVVVLGGNYSVAGPGISAMSSGAIEPGTNARDRIGFRIAARPTQK